MNNFKRSFFVGLAVTLLALTVSAQQNTLVQTSLSAAITDGRQTCFTVASATGINAATQSVPGSDLYIVDFGQARGELVRNVSSVTGTTVCARRAGGSHASGAMVLVATVPNWFATSDPGGSCVAANTYVTPVLNSTNGRQWLCSTVTGTWVSGFGGDNGVDPAATAAVASAAGLITPSGPLFHVTDTAAITGFNIPVGFNGGQFCMIPDGLFTTTSANNIALGSTAVVSKPLCYQYDKAAAKPFFPSY